MADAQNRRRLAWKAKQNKEKQITKKSRKKKKSGTYIIWIYGNKFVTAEFKITELIFLLTI